MNDLKWTLGPWETNGTAIETVSVETLSVVIGRAYDEREDCGIESESEAEANARLMAAAPELYASLKMASDIISGKVMGSSESLKMIDASLAKARGGDQP